MHLHAQSDPAGDPSSTSGDFDGLSTTGGSYDTYTANGKRTITDVTVPASVGAFPLQFTRIYNSRYNYVPSVVQVTGQGGIQGGFGDANWRHNYQWAGQITTSNGVTTYQVGYPDGRVINFQARANKGFSDSYLRGPAPTPDRFAVNPYSDGLHYLHLNDGSQVQFSVQKDSNGNADLLRAELLFDPNGVVTYLSYTSYQPVNVGSASPVTVLDHITDSSGRKLYLEYGTQYFQNDPNYGTDYWVVINDVYWTDSQGRKQQDATYGYYVYGPGKPNEITQTTIYCALSYVQYSVVSTQSGGQVSANYTYQAANNPGTLGTAPPLLLTANDPFYAGPMHQIRYTYSTANSGTWGVITSEQNLKTGKTVTSLSQFVPTNPSSPTTATETRGDTTDQAHNNPISRSFTYGETQTQSTSNTYARGFQVTTSTDFQGNPTYTYYYANGDPHGWGNVAKVVDATGNATGNATTYATEPYVGKVTQVTSPDGRNRQTVWGDADGSATNPYFVLQTTDERGGVTTYHREGNVSYQAGVNGHDAPNTGLINQIDYPDGSHEYLGYQSFGGSYYKVASYKNRLGAVFQFTYGANNGQGHADLLKSVQRTYNDALGQSHSESISYTYGADNRVNSVKDQGGVKYQFTYDAHGRIITVQAADNTTVQYAYYDDGTCASVLDELSHTTSFAYDDYRRPTSVTVPVNDGNNNNSRTVYYGYNRLDSNYQNISPAGVDTAPNWSVAWLPSGKAIVRSFTSNRWLSDEYDGMTVGSAGPASPQLNPETVHTTLAYNVLGQVLNSTDAQGFVTKATYDQYNRLSTVTDPLGVAGIANHVYSRTYYGVNDKSSTGTIYNGMLSSVTVPGPDLQSSPTVTTNYSAYDILGRVTQIKDPAAHPFDTGYNALDGVNSQGDGAQAQGTTVAPGQTPGAHLTGYNYDQLGRKSVARYPDGSTETWAYDASGNVASYKNRAGKTCTYSYSLRNICTGYSWNDNATSGVTYTPDNAGRITDINNNSASIHFVYDDSGGLMSETDTPAGQTGLTTTYTRDQDGNIVTITYPSGNVPSFNYDHLNRCTGMNSGGTQFSTYNFNNYGNNYATSANGVPTRSSGTWLTGRTLLPNNGNFYTYYSYQDNGRVNQVWHHNTGANKNISRHLYGYAPDGQISWTDRENDQGQSTASGSSLENGRGDVFNYYPDGSLQDMARDIAVSAWPAGSDGSNPADGDTRVTDGGGSYSGTDSFSYYNTYTYDGAGNRTQYARINPVTNSGFTINYGDNGNGENQYAYSGYADTDGTNNGNTTNSVVGWTYHYDAEGKLINATPSGSSNPTMGFAYDGLGRLMAQSINGVFTYFYYSGSQRIEELDQSNNVQSPRYLYFYDAPGSDQILFRQGVDGLSGGQPRRLWYLSDAMGNTSHVVTDAGTVVEQYLYDAYGTPNFFTATGSQIPSSQIDNRYLFKGAGAYQWIAPMGTYICRARFYLPQHGRFLQTDPIGQAGGLNLYRYCHNDPVNNLDPSGLDYFGIISYQPEVEYVFDYDTGEIDSYVVGYTAIYGIIPGNAPTSGNGKAGGNGGSSKSGSGGKTIGGNPTTRLVTPGVSLIQFPRIFPGATNEGGNEGVHIALSGISTYADVYPIYDDPFDSGVPIDPIDILTGFISSGLKVSASSILKSAAKTAPRIGATGQIGENALRQLGGKSQRFFNTSLGGRYVDQLVNGVANEAKVGYQALTPEIRLQVMKDIELMQTQQVQGAIWNFYRSPITGRIGPSGPLGDLLNQNNIPFVLHY